MSCTASLLLQVSLAIRLLVNLEKINTPLWLESLPVTEIVHGSILDKLEGPSSLFCHLSTTFDLLYLYSFA